MVMMMFKRLFMAVSVVVCFFFNPAVAEHHQTPCGRKTAPCRPTSQHNVLSAKERAPTPNSASGGGVERSPPGDGLLGPREMSGSSGREGFPTYSGAFPFRCFVSPVWSFYCMEGVLGGMEYCHPPRGYFLISSGAQRWSV